MREVVFLRKNAEKWKEIESAISVENTGDPDVLAERYVELTDDLAYAQTYYPKSNTTAYLNSLTTKIHQAIYRNKKVRKSRILTFVMQEYPAVIATNRRHLFTAFAIFVLAAIIGIISTLNDDGFVRLIMGDAYVNMTLKNILKDDPMAVYRKMNNMDSFSAITFNNIRVSFNAFVMGLLFCVGTAWMLFYNGIMLGTFHAFLYEEGVLVQGLTSIWIHGVLEISAIVIAGAAGFVMGGGFMFPGTLKRIESFKRGARSGVKMLVGLIPIFIIAGFLEGFVTRHTKMPIGVSLTIILLSLLFVVYYWVILPHGHLNRRTEWETRSGPGNTA
jgi:uncharacterized membrane protein SpoIIM required for sporulation